MIALELEQTKALGLSFNAIQSETISIVYIGNSMYTEVRLSTFSHLLQ